MIKNYFIITALKNILVSLNKDFLKWRYLCERHIFWMILQDAETQVQVKIQLALQ